MKHAILTFAASLALVAAAAAQDPFGPYKGELSRMQPPDWMKEGTRLQWEVMGASIPGKDAAPAGAGVMTADIVSLVGTTAAVCVRTQAKLSGAFGGEALGAPTEQGMVVPAASAGEYWVHPDVLAKTFRSLGEDGPWKAFKGPFEVNGRKIPAIQFVTGGGPKDLSRTSLVYEEATGIMLSAITSQRRNVSDSLHATGVHQFLARRDRKLPWAMGRPPKWLATLVAFQYSGSRMMEIDGAPAGQLPVSLLLTREQVGTNFVVLKMQEQDQRGGGAPLGVRVSGPTQVGGIWLPPLDIRKLRQGQVCDVDEVTQTRTFVGYVGPTQYGRQVVTIVEQSPGYELYMDYELSTGILLVVTLKDKMLSMSMQVGFSGTLTCVDPAGG